MIGDNIKQYRKANHMTQEELARQLHVVRQTISKWENNLSVPDADQVVQLSEILHVPVGALLDISDESLPHDTEDPQTEAIRKKRGLILSLSIASMLLSLLIQQEVVSVLLSAACLMAAAITLCRNLTLLTIPAPRPQQAKALHLTTRFTLALATSIIGIVILMSTNILHLSEQGEKILAVILISCVMLFGGYIAPKLPYNRHTGLRLPWTVIDEETWYVAHRVLGIISFPLALLYMACAWAFPPFGAVTLCAMALWIGIPGGISYFYYFKKFFKT